MAVANLVTGHHSRTPSTSRDASDGQTTKHGEGDPPSSLRRSCQLLSKRIVSAAWFSLLLTIVNIVNCILIGLETDCRMASGSVGLCSTELELLFVICEYVFLTCITIELVLHIVVDLRYVCSAWGVFDVVIVLLSIFNAIAIQPLFLKRRDMDTLSSASGLRIFRLLRLSRSLVKILRFPELWIMVRGLLGALRSIAWIIMLGCFVVYIFAVLGVEMFSSIGQSWASVGEVMVTLLQIATFDEWISTVNPLWSEFPISGHTFVILFMMIVGFTLMSLVTATLTERVLAENTGHARWHADVWSDDFQRGQERLKQEFPHADMTKKEFVELWESNFSAQHELKNLGTLEELTEHFDLMTGGDTSFIAIKPDDFCSALALHRQDRTAYLSTLCLRHLRIMKRRMSSIEHSVEASRAQQIELLAAAGPRCAEVSEKIRGELETNRCREDSQREKRLDRMGFPSVEVTKLRHVFELAGSIQHGELDFDDFAALFPRTAPKIVKELWASVVDDHSWTIDLDEFLDVVVRNGGAKNVLRTAVRHQTPRSVCTPEDALEDAKKMIAQTAEAAAERMAEQVSQQAAEHAVAARFTLKSSFDSENGLDHLAQQAFHSLRKTGQQILMELQETAASLQKSLMQQHAESLDEFCKARRSPSFGTADSQTLEPQSVNTATVEATALVTSAGSQRPRPLPLEFPQSPGAGVPLTTPVTNPQRNVSKDSISSAGARSSLHGSVQTQVSAEMGTGLRLAAASAQSPVANALNVGMAAPAAAAAGIYEAGIVATDASRNNHVGTPGNSVAFAKDGFDASMTSPAVEMLRGPGLFVPPGEVENFTRSTPASMQSPWSGSRPCLLTQTESLARQVNELDRYMPH